LIALDLDFTLPTLGGFAQTRSAIPMIAAAIGYGKRTEINSRRPILSSRFRNFPYQLLTDAEYKYGPAVGAFPVLLHSAGGK
jgi:hypothetical protein